MQGLWSTLLFQDQVFCIRRRGRLADFCDWSWIEGAFLLFVLRVDKERPSCSLGCAHCNPQDRYVKQIVYTNIFSAHSRAQQTKKFANSARHKLLLPLAAAVSAQRRIDFCDCQCERTVALILLFQLHYVETIPLTEHLAFQAQIPQTAKHSEHESLFANSS